MLKYVMISYNYPLFRPPAEAQSIIVQVTIGCSYNSCSFCSMYKTKKYRLRCLEDIYKDIDTLSNLNPKANKVFLADGDALSVDSDYLIEILKYLRVKFKCLRRVSSYASAQNILNKSSDELDSLYNHKLNLIYFGVETGNDIVLKKITKSVSQEEIIKSLNKASNSNIKISATVILGLGGSKYSMKHIQDSAKIINETNINYLSTLQLGLEDSIEEGFYKHFSDYKKQNDFEILEEQKNFLKCLKPKNRVIFRSNHASNALHLSGIIPRDNKKMICEIERALNEGKSAFVPNILRGF